MSLACTTPIEFADSRGATAWTAVDSICAKHQAVRNETQRKAVQPVAEMGARRVHPRPLVHQPKWEEREAQLDCPLLSSPLSWFIHQPARMGALYPSLPPAAVLCAGSRSEWPGAWRRCYPPQSRR